MTMELNMKGQFITSIILKEDISTVFTMNLAVRSMATILWLMRCPKGLRKCRTHI